MKFLILVILAAAFQAGFPASGGADTPAPAPAGYDRYKLVRTRNIFDPDRRAMRPDGPVRPPPTAAGPRANYFSLTGTMVTSGKSLAFFSGSQPDYSKVVSPGGKIADFTVTKITGAQVELTAGDKPTILAVGRQLAMQGGNYTVQAAPAVAAAPAPETAPASSDDAPKPAASPAVPAAAGGAQSDVQRRMMERRQKELSR